MKRLFLTLFVLCYYSLTDVYSQCWQTVSAGIDHSVAIRPDGTIWAWGFNGSGQLGDGTIRERTTPTKVWDFTSNWAAVVAGGNHSLAIKQDGTIWAWGENQYGQIGDGSSGNRKLSPVKIGAATNWKSIAAGRTFSLAIKTDGTLWSWGDNFYGQLGHGISPAFTPKQVGTDTDWKFVTAGGNHVVAIKNDNSLWAWGSNMEGQLGDGTTSNRPSPVKIGDGWASVSAGYDYTVAMKLDGTLWAWGNNDMAQLGDGTFVNKTVPTAIGSSAWKSVVAGYVSTIGIKADGTLWSWGKIIGKFGNGPDNTYTTPNQVGVASNWISVVTGDYHAFAFDATNTLWGWGEGTWGKLGDGAYSLYVEPVIISSPAPTGTNVQQFCFAAHVSDLVAAGTGIKWYSDPTGGAPLPSATVLVDGTHYYATQTISSCESAYRFDVTVNVNTTPVATPSGVTAQSFCNSGLVQDLKATGSGIVWYKTPTGGTPLWDLTPITNGHYYASQKIGYCESATRLDVMATIVTTPAPVGATTQSLCAGVKLYSLTLSGSGILLYGSSTSTTPIDNSTVTTAGGTYFASQTVNGCESASRLKVIISTYANTTPAPTDPHQKGFSAVMASSLSTLALKDDGTLWGWGWNHEGQLTSGPSGDGITPKPVAGQNQWETVELEEQILALKPDGSLWAWGPYDLGQLGIGNEVYNGRDIMPVEPGVKWREVAAAVAVSYGIKEDGTLWAWGDARPYLGDNGANRLPVRTPYRISLLTDWNYIAAGDYDALAIRVDGSLYGWGQNILGELGTGTTEDVYKPTRIGSDTDWKIVDVGYRYFVGLKVDGTLWSWGDNANGKLGQGTLNAATVKTPTKIGTDSDWKAISCSSGHALALKNDGTLWAWGANNSYQLGDGTAVAKGSPTQVGTDNDWVDIAAGSGHSVALKANGTIWAWGSNFVGQIGDGTTKNVKTPKQILTSYQEFCAASKVGDLDVMGLNTQWYTSPTGGAPIIPSTTLADQTYFATQTIGTCESQYRLPVTVRIITPDEVPAPSGQASQSYCAGATVSNLIAIGRSINWYSASTGGAPLAATEPIIFGNHYYASQSIGNCESPLRLDVLVSLSDGGLEAPTGASTQTLCSPASLADLVASGTGIQWYSALSGGEPLPTTTDLVNNTHYFASQKIGSCESTARLDVVVVLIQTPPPTGLASQVFCNDGLVSQLQVTGTNVQWYDTPTGGVPTVSSTPLDDGKHYYASQSIDGCESSQRFEVTVALKTTAAPEGNSNQQLCEGSTVDDLDVTAPGLIWYDASTGWTIIAGSAMLHNGSDYFASQTIDACESIARLKVTPTIVPTPEAPIGAPSQQFESGKTVADIVVTGSGVMWYGTEDDAAQHINRLAPSTLLTAGETY